MLRAGALLILAVFLAAAAPIPSVPPSQPPIPSAANTDQPEQKKPDEQRAIGPNNGNAAQDSPTNPNLTFSPKIDIKTGNASDGGNEKSSADWWLVGFTGALVVAAFVTYLTFRKQADIMDKTLVQMRADAVTRAKETKDQIDLARADYAASYRPKLRVRLVRIDQPILNKPITVRYEVVNVGGTQADIIDNEVTIRIIPSNAARRYSRQPPNVTNTRQFFFANFLRQGEALPATGEITNFDPAWGYSAGHWWKGRLFVIGTIRYKDGNGVTRRTAFYRRATEDLNRFEFMDFSAAQKADLEYED